MSILISGLKLPLKIVSWLLGGKRKKAKRTEREEKQRKYVRNFAPIHYSWQKSIGRDKKKRKSKRKFVKKLNHSKV